jgi:hypothetical protein
LADTLEGIAQIVLRAGSVGHELVGFLRKLWVCQTCLVPAWPAIRCDHLKGGDNSLRCKSLLRLTLSIQHRKLTKTNVQTGVVEMA